MADYYYNGRCPRGDYSIASRNTARLWQTVCMRTCIYSLFIWSLYCVIEYVHSPCVYVSIVYNRFFKFIYVYFILTERATLTVYF